MLQHSLYERQHNERKHSDKSILPRKEQQLKHTWSINRFRSKRTSLIRSVSVNLIPSIHSMVSTALRVYFQYIFGTLTAVPLLDLPSAPIKINLITVIQMACKRLIQTLDYKKGRSNRLKK